MISQRKSPSRGSGVRASEARESAPGMGLEKFMSVMLTYLRFNVTKRAASTKYSFVSCAVTF
jgi:hypothetical protein